METYLQIKLRFSHHFRNCDWFSSLLSRFKFQVSPSEMLLRVTSTVWLNRDARLRRSSCLMAADGRRRQWTGRTRTSERRKREGQTGKDRERRRIDMRSSYSPDIPSPELYLYVSFLHARPARLPRLPLSLFYSLFGIESTLINQPDVSKLLGTLSKSRWIRYLKR